MTRFSSVFLLSCVLAYSALVSEARITGRDPADPVSPKLSPKKDSTFFGRDYPSDERPSSKGLAFQHPYPVVQDSDDFDKDFVKDENKDNGLWAAQMAYDKIRAKMYRMKGVSNADVAKEKKKLDELLAQRAQAQAKLQELKEKADALNRDKNAAEDGAAEKPSAVGGLEDDLENAIAAFEDCKDEVRKARAELKRLLKELEEAKKKEQIANDNLKATKEKYKDSLDLDEKAEAKVTEETKRYEQAEKDFVNQQAEVKDFERKLEEARKKVASYRASADADGGVYPVKQKSAASPLTSSFTVFVLAASAFLATSQGA